jgi:hypothetical protein
VFWVVLGFYQEPPVPVLKKQKISSITGFGFGSHNWTRLKTQLWFQFQKSDPVPVWFVLIETETSNAIWPNWVNGTMAMSKVCLGYHH